MVELLESTLSLVESTLKSSYLVMVESTFSWWNLPCHGGIYLVMVESTYLFIVESTLPWWNLPCHGLNCVNLPTVRGQGDVTIGLVSMK